MLKVKVITTKNKKSACFTIFWLVLARQFGVLGVWKTAKLMPSNKVNLIKEDFEEVTLFYKNYFKNSTKSVLAEISICIDYRK